MKILQQPIKVKRNSRVNVYFNKPCTVYLMTEVNFKRYKDGASFRRIGGEFKDSPAQFVAPYDGTWHAVIEKGSHFKPVSVEGRVEVLPPVLKEKSYFLDPDVDVPTRSNSSEESFDEDNSSGEKKKKKHKAEEEENESGE